MRARLPVGLIGLGRLGRVYARDLATRVTSTRLVAVADPAPGVAEAVAAEFDVPRAHADPEAVLDDPEVKAVVIVSPTRSHREQTVAAAGRGKAIFCEKPPALALSEARAMKEEVERRGVFFHMGFMRRYDAGYAAAHRRVGEGEIGTPVLFKSTSRDPRRTTLEYADPRNSGGMISDMGVHDFDLARWFMGEARTVHAIGGTLAYPELKTVGDIDNAVVTIVFADGRLGEIDLSRNGVYGYDISTELLGTAGTLRIGYLRETPLLVMTPNSVAHDTVPYFMERFAGAYTAQLQDFADAVIAGRPPAITIDDGIGALRLAVAATQSCRRGLPVEVAAAEDA
jgi:inositol 2-dehydrogenase